MIHLHTLGDTLITVGEKEIRPTAPMLFAALLYLGIERGRRVPRAALQELLFPNAGERSGAHSLRQLLYKLRQLGAPIETDAATASVRSTDVSDDFTLFPAKGDNGSWDRLAGGFLPDYAPQISERFDEWLEDRRSVVAADIRRHVIAALTAGREAANWAVVERCSHLILSIDPLNEEATLALAEAAALSGSKAEALGILSRYTEETGRAELRLTPSLLKRRISEALPEQGPAARSTPFLGRESEVAVLRTQARIARSGRPSLVVIAGEPGIGKTRLLEETAALAALDGMQVYIVRCRPHYETRPLSAFMDLVPALLRSRGAIGVSPQSLTQLKLLVSHVDSDEARPIDVREDLTRSELLQAAIRDLVDAVASERPILLAIEDGQWSDAASLGELIRLVEGPDRALAVAVTTRVLEPLKCLTADDTTIVLRLKPLRPPAMRELAAHLLRSNRVATDDIASWCVDSAAGNPLFLQMLCAHADATQTLTLPPDLLSALSRRIELLPNECRRLLEFSALLGRHCTIETLSSLLGCSQLQLLSTVRRLEDESYLHIRNEAVRITHDLVAECVLNLVPPVSCRILHACVAANLEERYEATRDASVLWDCAEQWTLSGEASKALQLLRRCASHAMKIGRAADALSILGRAKALARSAGETGDVIGEMMMAARAAGHWMELSELSAQWSILGVADSAAGAHSPLELLAVESSWLSGVDDDPTVPRLLKCANDNDAPPSHRIEAALLVLRMAHEICDRTLAASAFTIVEPLLELTQGYASRCLPIIYHTTFGDRTLALELARGLRTDLLTFSDSVADQVQAASTTAMALALLGASQEAFQLYGEYYDRTLQLGMVTRSKELSCSACAFHLMLEDYEQATFWHDRSEATYSHHAFYAMSYFGNSLALALHRKDNLMATHSLRELERALPADSLRRKAQLQCARMQVRQLDCEFLCDEHTLRDLTVLFEKTREFLCSDSLAGTLAEALRRSGRMREAKEILAEYLHYSRRHLTPAPPSLLSLLEECSACQ